MKNRNKKKGFTIVELIIVMAIIGILILIAVPTLSSYLDMANDTAEMGDAKVLYTSALAAVAEESLTGTNTYNSPTTSNNYALSHTSDLYLDITGGTSDDYTTEVYTVTTGDELNYFDYVNVGNNGVQYVDEWSVILPITSDKNGKIDINGDIYIIPPAYKPERYVYKNGVNTGIVLSEYKVDK